MGFVTGREGGNDVFISYAHNDNEPFPGKKVAWVDYFESTLLVLLKGKVRGEIKIFRDQQLRRNGKFSAQLAEQLSSCAVFISILSPNYVESDWCIWELEQFVQRTGSDRIFKVVKTDFDRQSVHPSAKTLLAQLEQVLDSRFYQSEENHGAETELRPELFEEHRRPYFQIIEPLAIDIVSLLKRLHNASQAVSSAPTAVVPQAVQNDSVTVSLSEAAKTIVEAQTPAVPQAVMAPVTQENQITVYLAETTKDLAEAYSSIRTELAQFDVRVLPDQPLPQDADELPDVIGQHLRQAKLSIHLVGAKYGTVYEGAGYSVPHLQYNLAAKLLQPGRFKQLIWSPPDLAITDAKQQAFVADLMKSRALDYCQVKLEDLKTLIQQKLRPDDPNPWDSEDGTLLNLCLVCHKGDAEVIKPLFNHLMFNEPFNVKVLQDAGSLPGCKELLQTSDAVLMYYGQAGQDWFAPVLRMVRKHSVAGRVKPVLARAIYSGQPQTPEKDLLEFDDPLVIKSYEDFKPSVLMPFMERIRERIRLAQGGA